MQKIEKADEIRDMINHLADMRDDLNRIYDQLEDKEQTTLNYAIVKLELTMKRMGRRLLKQRMNEAWVP